MYSRIQNTSDQAKRFALDKYRLIKQIGQGGCGKVYLAKNIVNSEQCAIKRICPQTAIANKYLADEISTMKAVKHIPGVVRYIDSFKKQETTSIVMEHINGWNLQSIVENLELEERVIATLCKSILKSLQQVHELQIIHRDIKCGNIMLTNDGETKLIDFGYATYCPEGGHVRSGKIGSMFWMAPEISQRKPYNEKSDIWSFGIMVMEMFLGDPPYYSTDKTNEFIVNRLAQGDVPIVDSMSSDLQEFVQRCLAISPEDRPSAEELLNDKFLDYAIPLAYVSHSVAQNEDRLK
ncbi:hypothetical protein LOD99_5836 [Oopsacas minuta]|uniref:Protein kinase domain-containing protein n=1 Tax=Oopsacas minuta TaxID=111878 RepID=A0AAV7JNM6_9METZ|nr:hypothetical protein LOD99_5836 [Oopsacas minuta]